MTEDELRWFQSECPAATEEELRTLDDILDDTFTDGYTLSDLVDALRLGRSTANMKTAPTDTPKESDATLDESPTQGNVVRDDF